MTRYITRRLLWACVLFIAVTVVSYIIFYVIPVDPAKLVAGKGARPEDIRRAAHFIGTDKPVWWQYGRFLGRVIGVHWVSNGGDFWHFHFMAPSLGTSFANRQSINSVVGDAAPVTASLVFGGLVLWMLIALPIGIFSALRPRSILDRAAMVFVLIGISAHPVWIGYLFSYFFGYKLKLTPITGYCNFFHATTVCSGAWPWFYHLILPWATYAILFAALYVRMIRANVMEALNEDYVRTARAKGASESRVIGSHVLRNALLPVVTMLGMDLAVGLGGAIFTESVYGLPGLGHTLVASLQNFDLPTTLGITVFATTAIIVINLFIDVIYAVIDPRIRLT
jgi:peptide/nickel transport system permease protein